MGEALKQFHPEDIEVSETRVGRKHEVTAIHKLRPPVVRLADLVVGQLPSANSGLPAVVRE
jgi:hypothetical protein